MGTDISVQKPSTISSCDSQASGGPVSPSTEERIHELEQRLQNTEGMSSKTFEEELQHKEQEVSTELQKKELEDKLQELQEKVEVMITEQKSRLRLIIIQCIHYTPSPLFKSRLKPVGLSLVPLRL